MLWHGLSEIGGASRILMLGAPVELDAGEVVDAMRGQDGVEDVHHVHLWRFDERRVSLEAHVVLSEDAGGAETKQAIRAMLSQGFEIGHVTLETELPGEICQSEGGVAA